jgi:hypothetical protein
MILILLAALTLQKAEPPDAATAVLVLSEQCLAVMTSEAEPPATSRWLTLSDGREAEVVIGAGGCTLNIEGWSDDGGAFATAVRDGLSAQSLNWTVSQWRERQVNESGPARWSAMVVPDIRRHSAYWMQIIEPERGAPDRLSVSFGIGP